MDFKSFFDTLATIFSVGTDVMKFFNGILKYTGTVVDALKWVIDFVGGLGNGGSIGDLFSGLF